MNNGVIGFVIGAGIAGFITYFVMDRKIKALEKDNEETREYYRQRLKETNGEDQNESSESDGGERHFRKVGKLSEQNELKDKILAEHYNYSDISTGPVENVKKEKGGKLMIFEISPDEFDEDDEHDKVSITWYVSQHILADDDEHQMSPEFVGGADNLKDFSNDGVKYIRNENNKIDYEIVLDDVNKWMDPEAED